MSRDELHVAFDDFTSELVEVETGAIQIRRAGRGPAVLLLHGFPETSLAWREVAPSLASEWTVIAADLPGYGQSTVADKAFDEGRLSKRAMGHVLIEAMRALDIAEFAVVGHDRGARVAYRLALDHPDRIRALGVLDVIPILDMAERLTYDSARQMSHWFWLTSSSTVPETLIGLDADAYVRFIIDQWGGDRIQREVVDEYARRMSGAMALRTMGAEYRADHLDLEHDRSDRRSGRRIGCPVLALWAENGLAEQFGDPLTIWRQWADAVSGGPLRSGHFLMEERPEELIARLRPFLADAWRRTRAAV